MSSVRNKSGARAPRKPGGQPRVAVCIDTRDGPGRERLSGCYQYALERNWRLYLMREDNEDEIGEMAALDLDGAIFYDRSRALQAAVKRRGVLCIETGARHPDLADAAVFVDDGALARMAVGHLRAVGFENVGYCGLASSHPSRERAAHLLREAAKAGLAARAFEDKRRDGQLELARLRQWLDALPKPAGVLTYDDKMGERVLAACRWANIRVPDEIGVIGIGNDELICNVTLPCLSSVALPARKIGQAAAAALERLMAGEKLETARLPLAPLEVVCRASTDRLPPARPAVLKAVGFIRAESHRPVGTDQVAAAAGVPRRTLERAFRDDLGRTVHDCLVELRVQNAKRLLRHTDLPLADVAGKNGYLSLSSFIRMFTAQTGKPPREYRRQHKPQGGD